MLLIQLLKKQEKTMSAVKKTMEKIGEVLEDFCDEDCYDRISETSKPRELTKRPLLT